MKKWASRLSKAAVGIVLLSLAVGAAAYWLGNKPAEPMSPQEIDQRYAKAIGWLKANETVVLADRNSALWWILQAAAERTNDPYLHDLVQKGTVAMLNEGPRDSPWQRMLDPKAEVTMSTNLQPLASYQRFFHHAVTCVPVLLPGEDTNAYLEGRVCPPVLKTVLLGDPACSTHQLMGVHLFQRTGCKADHDLAPLESALLDDIEAQLTLDPVMKDAYIQRVMMLAWHGRSERIKPIWLRRTLEAQDGDGGWRGYRRLPELPESVQPWTLREYLAQRWPKRFPPEKNTLDFHATAQGLLLLSLLKAPTSSYNASVHQETVHEYSPQKSSNEGTTGRP